MKISNEAIIKAVRNRRGEPLPFRELMLLFGIDKGRRARFKEIVDRLVDAGELVRLKGNLLTAAAASDVVAGRLATHRDGYGFVVPEEGGEDIFIPARFLRESFHGDRVEVRITSVKKGGRREGRVVRTLERAVKKVVGRFEAGRGAGRVIADEQRITRDIMIPPAAEGGARSGQTVVAAVTRYPLEGRPAEGTVVEVLGWPDDPAVEALAIIRKYDLPDHFPDDVTAAARAVPAVVGSADLAGRTDLRGVRTVTIDGETARDFDDAVAVRCEDGGRIRLWVSIADVAHYVTEGSPVDREALKRGTSVYFPDRCIPMLPEELSNGICSLNPDVDRLTVTAELLFDRAGGVVSSAFYPSVIHSSARLTYTAVAELLAGSGAAPTVGEELVADLRLMEKLALRLMARRRERGSIDFDLPEPEIVLDLQGATLAIIRAERTIAHRLIEEFMLAANEAVARFVDEHRTPFLYRVHELPDAAKLQDFAEFARSLGHELRLEEGKVEPGEFQRLLAAVEGEPEERLVNQLLLRCMKQARYAAENLGHFGLASSSYTHFTSPIRRYPDLVVHRILKDVLGGALPARRLEWLERTLPEVAEQTSQRERVAMEAEREIVTLKKVQFMADKVGEEFSGFITGVTPSGFFVELSDYFVEGMVRISALPPDFYLFMEKEHVLVAQGSRKSYRLGDRVEVRVANVSIARREIDFVLAGQTVPSPGAPPEEYPRIPVKGKQLPHHRKKGGDGKQGFGTKPGKGGSHRRRR